MLKAANYGWRLIATAFSFISFGIGGLCLTLVAFPIINIYYKNTEQRKLHSRSLISKCFRFFLNMMAFFRMFDFDIYKQEEELKQAKRKIVIANHPSLIDIVVLLALMPSADCIVKESLWTNPFLKGVVRAACYIKNSQDISVLLEACKKSLDTGYTIIIFPEGTRTKKNDTISLRRGASNIALRCDVDIVPVTLTCRPTTLTKNEAWYEIPDKKAHFVLTVGKEIKIEQFKAKSQSLAIQARRLTVFIEEHFIGEQAGYERT